MSEGKLLHCPTCGSSLKLQAGLADIKCEYCGNNVIVPPELRQANPAGAPGANPIHIVMNDSGTSIQMADLSAFQPRAMNISVGESGLAGSTSPTLSPAASRWLKFGIWMFVIMMVASFILPIVCSVLGIFGGMAGALLPFFLK